MSNCKLTQEAKKKYVDDGGYRCPYCGTNDIALLGTLEYNTATTIRRSVKCDKCGAMWEDEFRLDNIVEVLGQSTCGDKS